MVVGPCLQKISERTVDKRNITHTASNNNSTFKEIRLIQSGGRPCHPGKCLCKGKFGVSTRTGLETKVITMIDARRARCK